jgi:hypothetical protein
MTVFVCFAMCKANALEFCFKRRVSTLVLIAMDESEPWTCAQAGARERMWARVRAGRGRGRLGQRVPAKASRRMVRRGRRPLQVEEVAPAPEWATRPSAAMGAAAGMQGGGGDACPCAEGAVDPRYAAAAET